MQKLSKETKVYTIIGVCILVLAAILYFVLRPQTLNINSKIEKIQESKLKLAQLESKEGNVGKLEKDYKRVTGKLDYLHSAIPTDKDIIDFIKELEKIASKTNNSQTLNLEVSKDGEATINSQGENLAVEGSVQKENKDVLEFQINLTGSFYDLIKYLVYFENLKYYSDITSLEIKAVTPQSGAVEGEKEIPEGTLNSVLNAKVYIR